MGNETQRTYPERISNEQFKKKITQDLQGQGNNNQIEQPLKYTLQILQEARMEAFKLQPKLKVYFIEYLQNQQELTQNEQTLQQNIYEHIESVQGQIEQNMQDLQDLGDEEVTQSLTRVLKLKSLVQQSSQKNNQMQLAIKKLQALDFPFIKPIQNQLEQIITDLKDIMQIIQGLTFYSNGFTQKLFSVKDTSFCFKFDISQNMKVKIEIQNTEKFDQHHRAIQLTENTFLVSGGQKQEGRLTLVSENKARKLFQSKGRYSHGVAFDMGENVFLIAGSKSDCTCEIFKYKKCLRQLISNYPFYAFNHSCAILYNFVYGFGGKDKDTNAFSNEIFYYDTITDKWFGHEKDLPDRYETLSVFLPQKASIFIFNNGNPQNQIQQFDGERINQICKDQDKGFCYNIPQFYGESIFFYNQNLQLWEYNSGNLKFRKLN